MGHAEKLTHTDTGQFSRGSINGTQVETRNIHTLKKSISRGEKTPAGVAYTLQVGDVVYSLVLLPKYKIRRLSHTGGTPQDWLTAETMAICHDLQLTRSKNRRLEGELIWSQDRDRIEALRNPPLELYEE
jgi:predicted membrane chloride channel (bestrophin family)